LLCVCVCGVCERERCGKCCVDANIETETETETETEIETETETEIETETDTELERYTASVTHVMRPLGTSPLAS